MPDFLTDPELWKYVSIPFVAAVVGWGTNWVAIEMTFYPLEFLGIPPFLGWQGIIPSKAEKMAATFVDSTMYRLGTVSELFEQMEPERMARHVVEVIRPRLDDYTDEVMLSSHAALWRSLPRVLKETVYERVDEELPRLVDNLMEEVEERIEELLDFKEMVTRRLVQDKALLNRLFLECGEAEFRFIIRSGFHFGFLFGLVQLTVWVLWPAWWVLPVFGLIVGYLTNWIALNLVFRPLHPRRIGPWTLQGLFLKRQQEVAAVWCRIVTREIVTVRRMISAMINGPRATLAHEVIKKHLQPVVDEAAARVGPMAQITVGSRGLSRIKESVGDKAVRVSEDPFEDSAFNADRAVVVERLLRERMEAMPAEDFQDLLRPCFQEDEMKLILVGAALGFLAGLAQLFFVFGARV